MTRKLTITDERVISVIERLEHYACNLKWTNVRGAQDLLTAADGLRELQERRKDDSEPVGEVSEQRNGLVMDGTVDLGGSSTHRIIKGASKMKRLPLGTKFYTAPPASVVPEVSPLISEVAPLVSDLSAPVQDGNSPVIPDGSKEALSEAVAAIYFTDSTDYLPALYSVVKALSPEVFAQLLSNEKAAFDATRLPAAPQEVQGE